VRISRLVAIHWRCFGRGSCGAGAGLRQPRAVPRRFEKKTTVKVLPTSTLVVCERPEAPVFSYYTLVDAGSATIPVARAASPYVRAHGLQGH